MLLCVIKKQTWILILLTIVKFTTSYYIPLCGENGFCFNQDVEDTAIISGMVSSLFDVFDATFGWIFHTLDYIGIMEQIPPKQRTSPLQKFVCTHHKKVLSMMFILLTSLLYVLNRGGKGNWRSSINDDLDFVEHFYRENNDLEDTTSYLDGADQNDEDY